MKRKYKVAVVGCGNVGVLYEADAKRPKPASHAGIAAAHKDTELVALVDSSARALARAGKLFPNAARYRSLKECLTQERPDIVIIATPTKIRLAPIKECIAHNIKAIICEKPLASSLTEAHAIEKLVKKSGIVLVLNYQRRFSPLLMRVRRDIKAGKLGAIQQVTCYYSRGLYNNGGHALDALIYMLGNPTLKPKWAQVNKRRIDPSGDPSVDVVLEGEKGMKVVLQSLDQAAYGLFDIRILGSKGTRALINYSNTLLETSIAPMFNGVKTLDRANSKVTRGIPGSALDEALRCLKTHSKPLSGIENGVAVLEVLEKISRYAKEK